MNVAHPSTSPQAATGYSFPRDVDGIDFVETVERVVQARKREGFGVLTEIDVQTTMKAIPGIEGRTYRIVGACNPPLARRSLQGEPDIGRPPPCNAVLHEKADGRVIIGFMDLVAVLQPTSNATVAEVAHEGRARMRRIKDALLAADTDGTSG